MIYSDVPNQESGDSKETKDSQEEPHDSEENEKPKFSEGLIDHYSATVSNKFVDSFKDKKNVEDFTVSVRNMPTGASTSLFQEEVVFAKKLAQMLDINHDSKPDVVKNLLHGKMDTDKLPEVLSGNNRVYTKTLENQSLKPFKVIVLGDYSGSMNHAWRGPTPITFQKKVMKSLFHMFHDVLGMDDIEFYGHSGVDEPILYKFHSPEYPHFMETFNGYIPLEENYDGPIIEHIHKMVRAKTNNPVLLISLSDGQPSGQNYGGKKANANMKRILEKVKRDNFVTVGIGMNYTHESNLYQYSVTINDLSSTSSVAQIINRAVKENLIVED
jgi:nitric oxide reductase activation protein